VGDRENRYFEYLRNAAGMKLPTEQLKAFLEYKSKKLSSIVEIEKQRLEDLEKSRSAVYKYALPQLWSMVWRAV
jgi:hypothetical protein